MKISSPKGQKRAQSCSPLVQRDCRALPGAPENGHRSGAPPAAADWPDWPGGPARARAGAGRGGVACGAAARPRGAS